MTSIATSIQNGHKTHTHDHDATGWIPNSFNTTKTIPTTVRQPIRHEQEERLDELELFGISFLFYGENNTAIMSPANTTGLQGNMHTNVIDKAIAAIETSLLMFVSPAAIISKTWKYVNSTSQLT